MSTFCQDCQHVHLDSKHAPPWRWLCTKHPRLNEGFGYVTTTEWDNLPPYLYCKDVNGGACPLYEKTKETESTEAERAAHGAKRGE